MAADFIDMAALKDDLGITGSTQDAWLARRVKEALALMSVYTRRYIGYTQQFIDEWNPAAFEACGMAYWPVYRTQVFTLRYYPIVEIDAAKDDGTEVENVIYDWRDGALHGYGSATAPNHFNMPTITYKAGWDVLPADLYAVLVGIIRPQWVERQNAAAGIPSGVSSISIQDVGDVELSTDMQGSVFERVATAQSSNPLLGPYTSILDHYIDHRSSVSSVVWPRTTMVPTP
jgi:hypothetical protein